jgi:hypothetical protein
MPFITDFEEKGCEVGIEIGMLENIFVPSLIKAGMSADLSRFRIPFYAGTIWGAAYEDFRIELFGVLSKSDDGFGGHKIELRRRDNGNIEIGHVWQRTVFLKYTKAYIREHWLSEGGYATSIHNIASTNIVSRIPEIQKLAEGLLLGIAQVQPGRDRLKSPYKIYQEAINHYKVHLQNTGQHPTVLQIAKAVGRSRTRFYEDMKDCGRSWELVRAEATGAHEITVPEIEIATRPDQPEVYKVIDNIKIIPKPASSSKS